MHFESINPRDSLKELIKEIWIYENNDPIPSTQKIIPDGFSEIILHYGDPYEINLGSRWELQSNQLFSSQISKFFYLRNTGNSGMIGIKLYPTAFYEIFEISVQGCTDKVLPLQEVLTESEIPITASGFQYLPTLTKVASLEDWLEGYRPNYQPKVRSMVQEIMAKNGLVNLDQLAQNSGFGLRQAERLFKKAIGITPKFFSRIVRFNHIFKIIEAKEESWISIALQSGFFDQSHFIKNFKEFTGEDPSSYGFDEKNLANFFLKS